MQTVHTMGLVHSTLAYEKADSDIQGMIKSLLKTQIQMELDKGASTFRVTQYSCHAFAEKKLMVTFPVSLYEEVCREVIKRPYCIRKKHHHVFEIMLVQNSA